MRRLCKELTHRWNAVILKISVEGDRREDFIMFPKHLAFPNMSLDVGQVWGIRVDCYGITGRKEAQASGEEQIHGDSLLPSPHLCIHNPLYTQKSHPLTLMIQIIVFFFYRKGSENNSWNPAHSRCAANTLANCLPTLLTCFKMCLLYSAELKLFRQKPMNFCSSLKLQVTLQHNCVCKAHWPSVIGIYFSCKPLSAVEKIKNNFLYLKLCSFLSVVYVLTVKMQMDIYRPFFSGDVTSLHHDPVKCPFFPGKCWSGLLECWLWGIHV